MLQKLKAAGVWLWDHKLAAGALLLPVVGVATAATMVAIQKRSKNGNDSVSPEERDRAERLERAWHDGELR